ncbi:MAG: aldo/keto reductase [Flaviflexus sp.]|nr:aldo/keto reductase [Flaviflexus sp.]
MTPMITLNDSIRIPQLGLGVWEIPADETERAVSEALEVGYRHIDTAAVYGNEEGVGRAINNSGIERDDIFLTTKLWNKEQGYDKTISACEDSLERLGQEFIDLYLIHWPCPDFDLYLDTWRAMEKLRSEGLVRSIGVSNFLPEHIDRLLANCEHAPSVNQLEVHPSYQQREATEAATAAGLAIEAYSPIGRGDDLSLEPVTQIAERTGATPAQVILGWHLAKGHIVIPKTVTRERMVENLAATEVRLSAEDIAAIDALEAGNCKTSHPSEFHVV